MIAQRTGAPKRQPNWITVGWQGITLEVPEDWYPGALGTDRSSGYLRVQSAEGPSVEVRWFSPKGTVDLEREVAKYRKTMERNARKRRQTIEWRDKPKVAVREARPDKSRRFFGWKGDAHALGVAWYCRTCARVVLSQVTMPGDTSDMTLAARILSSMEDHGEDGRDLWSLYGLAVEIPQGWSLEKHQLMAGYTMLQFRHRNRVLRTERWALASLALEGASLADFIRVKSRKFWKDYRLQSAAAEFHGHENAVTFQGRSRRIWARVFGQVRRWIRWPGADTMTVHAWHCPQENKLFAVHGTHPGGKAQELEETVAALHCHE